MTPQQINIKIAKKCGWKIAGNLFGVALSYDPKGNPTTGIPDYYKYLDACAEFEKTMQGGEHQYKYAARLFDIIYNEKKDFRILEFKHVCATAPQRCEAFLRLHRLW